MKQSSEVLSRARNDGMREKRDHAMLALLFGCSTVPNPFHVCPTSHKQNSEVSPQEASFDHFCSFFSSLLEKKRGEVRNSNSGILPSENISVKGFRNNSNLIITFANQNKRMSVCSKIRT